MRGCLESLTAPNSGSRAGTGCALPAGDAGDQLVHDGGAFVEDHAAADGAAPAVTQDLHRIDPAQAIAEVTAAGFTLEAQSDLLKNPDDPKTVGVRDPSVQGETEKFALRFRTQG